MTFPEFLAKWINPSGQRIDYDHVYDYQCVDLILEYVYACYGLATGAHGNAVDYWERPTSVLLSKFVKVETQDPVEGDITILSSPITPLGHIGIATGNKTSTQFEMMEQNGSAGNGDGVGGDAIRTRFIAKSRIIGVLRPITVVTGPPMITADQLNQVFGSLLNRAPDPGAVAHYVGHYTYGFVVSDVSNSAEWHAIHDPKPPAPPAAPVPMPASTDPYPILSTIKTYGSKTDAAAGTNPTGKILAGAVWYKYYEQDDMYNLTQVPGQSTGTWINSADNRPYESPVIPEPAPVIAPVVTIPVETAADIRATFLPILPDGSPVECEVLKGFLLTDVLGIGAPITVRLPRTVKVYGTFIAYGQVHALVKVANIATQDMYMYGVPVAARDNFAPFLSGIYRLSDHIKKNWELLFDNMAGILKLALNKIKNL